MRLITTCTAALLLPVLLAAQDGAKQQSPADALCAKFSAELSKQNSVYRAASSELRASEAYKKARADKDREKTSELFSSLTKPDYKGMAQKALEAAGQFEGDGAVKLLGWAAINGRDPDIVKTVVAQLQEKHMKSEALIELLENGRVLSRPLGAAGADAFLSQVIEESPHDVAKAWAFYWKSIAFTGRGSSDDQKAKGAEFAAQAETFAGNHWLADKIRGPKFKAEKLQTGLVAPNIVGEDIDGVKFQLEDYRGKVVVLDFWGFW
ncbi:MAG: hypothetical protein ACI89X_000963 [Planctomycetota bacterium]|jgi:hypothetical protein